MLPQRLGCPHHSSGTQLMGAGPHCVCTSQPNISTSSLFASMVQTGLLYPASKRKSSLGLQTLSPPLAGRIMHAVGPSSQGHRSALPGLPSALFEVVKHSWSPARSLPEHRGSMPGPGSRYTPQSALFTPCHPTSHPFFHDSCCLRAWES